MNTKHFLSLVYIWGHVNMTYEEIGREMGLSKSGVRKIEQRALAKASRILAEHGYTLADLFLPEIDNTSLGALQQPLKVDY